MRVRIAVAISRQGKWAATGGCDEPAEAMRDWAIDGVPGGEDVTDIRVHLIEADIPLPEEPTTIEGTVIQ